jgi:hypothetical protein
VACAVPVCHLRRPSRAIATLLAEGRAEEGGPQRVGVVVELGLGQPEPGVEDRATCRCRRTECVCVWVFVCLFCAMLRSSVWVHRGGQGQLRQLSPVEVVHGWPGKFLHVSNCGAQPRYEFRIEVQCGRRAIQNFQCVIIVVLMGDRTAPIMGFIISHVQGMGNEGVG